MISTLPNLLTLLRIILIPIVMATFYTNSTLGRWIAAVAFISACLTDFLDGYMARMLSQTSKLGQFLDPVADKLLVASTLLFLAGFDHISRVALIPATIILCREILVSGLRESLVDLKVSMPVSTLAKWKTAFQMTAISLLLLGKTDAFGSLFLYVGETCLWGAALLTLVTGYDYLRAGMRHF